MKDMPGNKHPQWKALCDEIVDRADGVFWSASFGLDKVVQGPCNGQSLDQLSAHPESVPGDLDGICKRIVDLIEPQGEK